jgi:hypothetical protein
LELHANLLPRVNDSSEGQSQRTTAQVAPLLITRVVPQAKQQEAARGNKLQICHHKIQARQVNDIFKFLEMI